MLANVDKRLLLALLIAVTVIAVVIIVGGVFLAIVKARKRNSPQIMRSIFFTIGAIIIAAISWIYNIGWLRFVLTFLAIPIFHAIAFFLTNFFSAIYFDKSEKLKKQSVLFFAE